MPPTPDPRPSMLPACSVVHGKALSAASDLGAVCKVNFWRVGVYVCGVKVRGACAAAAMLRGSPWPLAPVHRLATRRSRGWRRLWHADEAPHLGCVCVAGG